MFESRIRHWRCLAIVVVVAPPAMSASAIGRSFAPESQVAMAATPTSDAERDFTAMMIAHHQGALDMAQSELRHGRNRTDPISPKNM